jgi:hypothetical protein
MTDLVLTQQEKLRVSEEDPDIGGVKGRCLI